MNNCTVSNIYIYVKSKKHLKIQFNVASNRKTLLFNFYYENRRDAINYRYKIFYFAFNVFEQH